MGSSTTSTKNLGVSRACISTAGTSTSTINEVLTQLIIPPSSRFNLCHCDIVINFIDQTGFKEKGSLLYTLQNCNCTTVTGVFFSLKRHIKMTLVNEQQDNCSFVGTWWPYILRHESVEEACGLYHNFRRGDPLNNCRSNFGIFFMFLPQTGSTMLYPSSEITTQIAFSQKKILL